SATSPRSPTRRSWTRSRRACPADSAPARMRTAPLASGRGGAVARMGAGTLSPVTVDPAVITPPGDWVHRMIAAQGARFHVACAGPDEGPLVLLLHDFGQFWWAWR